MGVISGITRTVSRAVGGLTLDASSGVARAAEAAKAAVTGEQIGPATLRLAVVILSDEHGPLSSPEAIQPSIDLASSVFLAESGIRLRLTGIQVIDEQAPLSALDPHANQRLLLDDVLGHTEFYRRHSAPVDLASAVVGAPVTVIVVREIAGRVTGCSLGISADWVIVQASLFDHGQPHTYDETVLAHEIGHALNLPHRRDRRNLMFPESSPPSAIRGTQLQGWQTAILHSNRHIVPGVGR